MSISSCPCTAMEYCPAKIMSSCSKREREKDGAKLKLHSGKADNSLHIAAYLVR